MVTHSLTVNSNIQGLLFNLRRVLDNQDKCGVMLQRFWEHPPSFDNLVNSVKELGVGWIRIDIAWYNVEPTVKGQYDTAWFLPQLDSMVKVAKEHNLNILGVLDGIPNWASGGNGIYYHPVNLGDFADFVGFCINRYKSDIKYWQLWNEPSHTFDGGTNEEYLEMIRLAYIRAKSIDPQCITTCNWGIEQPLPAETVHGIVSLYALGIQNYFDILSFNAYMTLSEFAIVVPSLKNWLMSQGDGDREVWCTEFGFNLDWEGMTLEKQADNTVRTADILLSNNVTHIFYFCFWNSVDNGWGMVSDQNLTPRPVYYSYRNFIQMTDS